LNVESDGHQKKRALTWTTKTADIYCKRQRENVNNGRWGNIKVFRRATSYAWNI